MKRALKDAAISSIDKYLIANEWESPNLDILQFNYTDPKTGLSHRLDFAFFIQSERDIYEQEAYMKSKGVI